MAQIVIYTINCVFICVGWLSVKDNEYLNAESPSSENKCGVVLLKNDNIRKILLKDKRNDVPLFI